MSKWPAPLVNSKLDIFIREEGYANELDMLASLMQDNPGTWNAICMVLECDYITEMEPDQTQGWCDECKKNTMVSVLVLKGII